MSWYCPKFWLHLQLPSRTGKSHRGRKEWVSLATAESPAVPRVLYFLWRCSPANLEPYYQIGISVPQAHKSLEILNFEELDSPSAGTPPKTNFTCRVDNDPAAKMLIPKSDRKAIHEVRPILPCFPPPEDGRGILESLVVVDRVGNSPLMFEAVPLPGGCYGRCEEVGSPNSTESHVRFSLRAKSAASQPRYATARR